MLGERYFEEIKSIWQPFEPAATKKRMYIIPFCTPIVMNPPALVIGRNHTDFAPGNPSEALKIARSFSTKLPEENTFISHRHRFAVGLLDMCNGAGIKVTPEWVGTNRCAVQWDAVDKAIEQIRAISPKDFDDCQTRMDYVLRRFVGEIRPRNIILVGKFARDLFYAKAKSGQTYDDFPPKWVEFSEVGAKTWVIAVQNPGRPNNRERASARLREHFRRQ